jgi:hypothetical protein
MFNIQHLDVEQVMEQVVTDGQGRTFTYSSVIRDMRVTVKNAYGEITLCLHLTNVALLDHHPDLSVWGSLGRDWAAKVQAVADRRASVEHFDSTSQWQGGGVRNTGFGSWQMTQPQLRGHVVRIPYQELQVYELPESHPVFSNPRCVERELIGLMENVLPTAFHLLPLAFTFEMVPQLLWVAHAAHRDRDAKNDPDFQTPAKRMRSIPANLTANPLIFHYLHYPTPPAIAFGDLGVEVPASVSFLGTMDIPSSLYPFELRPPGDVLADLRRAYHYHLLQPMPNVDIINTLRSLGQELLAFIQHQDLHLAGAATFAQQLDVLHIPRFDSWACIQGCQDGNMITLAQLTTDKPQHDVLRSIDGVPEGLQVPTSWLLRQHDADLHDIISLQHKQLPHFMMESEQSPMSPQAIASQRYWPTSMEEQLVVTAGQMAMTKALKQQLQAGTPLHFMVPVDQGLNAVWEAMRWAMRTVRGPSAPSLLDNDEQGSLAYNRYIHHEAFKRWYRRRQDLEPALRSMGLQACYLLAATRMAQAEEPGPVTQRHLEEVGAIADLDVNAILNGLRAPFGPVMGHWHLRDIIPDHFT